MEPKLVSHQEEQPNPEGKFGTMRAVMEQLIDADNYNVYGTGMEQQHAQQERSNQLRAKERKETLGKLPDEVVDLLNEGILVPDDSFAYEEVSKRLNESIDKFKLGRYTVAQGENIVIAPLNSGKYPERAYEQPSALMLANTIASPSKYEFRTFPEQKGFWSITIKK
jgi:hypothetical protein